MADWAEELIDGGRLHDAIAVLALNVQMNPSSAAYANLARAQLLVGDKLTAAASYKTSLEKGTYNAEARRKLREIEVELGRDGHRA